MVFVTDHFNFRETIQPPFNYSASHFSYILADVISYLHMLGESPLDVHLQSGCGLVSCYRTVSDNSNSSSCVASLLTFCCVLIK